MLGRDYDEPINQAQRSHWPWEIKPDEKGNVQLLIESDVKSCLLYP
jgi:hypothetical protein